MAGSAGGEDSPAASEMCRVGAVLGGAAAWALLTWLCRAREQRVGAVEVPGAAG